MFLHVTNISLIVLFRSCAGKFRPGNEGEISTDALHTAAKLVELLLYPN